MPVPAGPSTGAIGISEVKARLNKTLTVDDTEIQDMLEAAEAEYEKCVGPISGTVTETLDGGGASVLLRCPVVSEITEAVYSDGTAIDVADLDLDTRTGIVYWGYDTDGRFTYGSRNVILTYTIGTLAANHREAIIADVAGYFEATQMGPSEPGDSNGYAAAFSGTPRVLFPRIRALTPPMVG